MDKLFMIVAVVGWGSLAIASSTGLVDMYWRISVTLTSLFAFMKAYEL